jgi:hypothetical protein
MYLMYEILRLDLAIHLREKKYTTNTQSDPAVLLGAVSSAPPPRCVFRFVLFLILFYKCLYFCSVLSIIMFAPSVISRCNIVSYILAS